MALGLPAQPRDLSEAKPETVGISSQRLERLHAVLQKYINDQQLPGMVTVLARHGKIVDFQTYGKRDFASGAPMEKDAIFRIFYPFCVPRLYFLIFRRGLPIAT